MDSDLDGKIGTSGLRASKTLSAAADRLGALQDLPGYWEGPGFGLIARPYSGPGQHNGFFLQLNVLREVIEFRPIGSPVVNRGSEQDDIAIYGVTYMHHVTDGVIGGALHVEPGMWLNLPATEAPKLDASIARLGTIPHGNAFCATGFVQHAEFDRIPDIPPVNTVPFPIGAAPPPPGTPNPYPEYDLGIPTGQRTAPLAAEITQMLVDDPNQALREVLHRQVDQEGKTLKKITRLITATRTDRAIANIPFITTNADTLDLESVFAIEEVVDSNGYEFTQLQYVQTALLDFRGMRFPHVTVGTLTKAF